ncbi:retrovirus-related Pol polyprotein from transposon 412 [Trichonephila clavipes]|nr:retrovirus-related Pol polyprotein from transposon 412 [Trichonephila clavipes]
MGYLFDFIPIKGKKFRLCGIEGGLRELLGIDKTKTTPLHPRVPLLAWWRGFNQCHPRTDLSPIGLQEPTRLGPESRSSLLLACTQRRSRDYRIFTIPDAFWPESSSPLVTCCLVAPPDTPSSPEEYVQRISRARFEDVHHLARERINLRTEKMKTRYDTKATGHINSREGDKVWFYNPTRRKGLSP